MIRFYTKGGGVYHAADTASGFHARIVVEIDGNTGKKWADDYETGLGATFVSASTVPRRIRIALKTALMIEGINRV